MVSSTKLIIKDMQNMLAHSSPHEIKLKCDQVRDILHDFSKNLSIYSCLPITSGFSNYQFFIVGIHDETGWKIIDSDQNLIFQRKKLRDWVEITTPKWVSFCQSSILEEVSV